MADALSQLGRPIRLAVIGGGPGSMIGEMHRSSARLDDRFEIVAGALSSKPDLSASACAEYGIDRGYASGEELIASESDREDGAEAVAIMTPNDSHHRFSMAALGAGLDVICDKPITNTLADANDIVRKVAETGLIFCLTHNYSGTPMVRQARAMVEEGLVGTIRMIQTEYVQGGKASADDPDPAGNVPWRYDPVKGGPSLILGDIGTHAHQLARFITGLEVEELTAQVGHIVPDRRVDDYAGALLRYQEGAQGAMWVTQAAPGMPNQLGIRVAGSLATLEWRQTAPSELVVRHLDGRTETRTPDSSDNLPLGVRSSEIAAPHEEHFSGFVNIYADAAEAIAARRLGVDAHPLAGHYPNARDGAVGIRFVEAAIESAAAGGVWKDARYQIDR